MPKSKQVNSLPIFPLTIVACPTECVPLHIYEERYKQLIADCASERERGGTGEFAIVLMNEAGDPCEVGTTVTVQKTLKTYEDGRMDLITLGRRRCRILELLDEQEYSTAVVEFFQDTESDWGEDLATQAFQKHRELTRVITNNAPGDDLYSGKQELSFHLLPTSGLTPAHKQAMLEMRIENDRLQGLVNHYDQLLSVLPRVFKSVEAIHAQWQVRKILSESD